MKKFTIGILLGLFLFPFLCDLARLSNELIPNKITDFLSLKTMVVGYHTENAFVGNCTKNISKNGHGWVFVNREYFKCGKVSIWISDKIYGEKYNE